MLLSHRGLLKESDQLRQPVCQHPCASIQRLDAFRPDVLLHSDGAGKHRAVLDNGTKGRLSRPCASSIHDYIVQRWMKTPRKSRLLTLVTVE